jgi:hypothetical protein
MVEDSTWDVNLVEDESASTNSRAAVWFPEILWQVIQDGSTVISNSTTEMKQHYRINCSQKNCSILKEHPTKDTCKITMKNHHDFAPN